MAAWFANATPEKIAQDKLLPLAKEISNRKDKGDYVIICTARNMSSADYEFLKKNNMVAHKIISRPVGNMEADGSLKAKQLSSFLSLRQFKRASKVMFDDAQSVRSAIRKIGIAVLDPAKIN